MKNVLEYSKDLLLSHLDSNSVVVDATLGNGNDTKFLCENFKYVYAFDVQEEAIISSTSKLEEFNNCELILDGHQNLDKYVTNCNGAIFNLGYLPNVSSDITTNSCTTILALEKLLDIIDSGIIVIVVYVGHDDGCEARDIEKYCSNLDKKYKVLKYQFLNRNNPPYILAIKI